MPKSFLIKRAHKVNTGFFPWNRETLVPGCCLEYEEEEYKHYDGISDNDKLRSEIRVLAPYNRIISPPRLIINVSRDNEEKASSLLGDHKYDDVIIPSPVGYVDERMSPPSYMDTLSTFKSHGMTHSGKSYLSPWHAGSFPNRKKHQCEFCFKWFDRSSSLSNHRLIHKNAKTFKCNQCTMSFLRKSDLGKHMVTHSGNKPYQCNVCGKRFSQSSNMLTHQRRHTGIRPYSCEICGKSFYRKVDVRRHASVHRDF